MSRGRRRARPRRRSRRSPRPRRAPPRPPLPDLGDLPFEERRDVDGWRARRARMGGVLGCERLGVSVWELPPGQTAYPYHFHLGDEELLVVLAGTPDLRTPDGWRTVAEGELLAFPAGADGAHQLVNRSEGVVRFVAISTSGTPDVVLYPDSGKLWAGERNPDGTGVGRVFRESDEADYYDGEGLPS